MACNKCGAKVTLYDRGRYPGEERTLCVCGHSEWQHFRSRRPTKEETKRVYSGDCTPQPKAFGEVPAW